MGAIDRPLAEGTVSRITAQKGDPTRVSLYLNGEFAFGLSAELAMKEGLRRGITLSVLDQERMLAEDQALSARAAAVAYVSRRSRTSKELAQWIERKGYPVQVAQDVVARLQSLGYVDDATYACRFAEARASRGYGARRIVQELAQKGISLELAHDALEGVLDDESEFESVRQLARRRSDRLQNVSDLRKRKKKVFDYLIRRGFSPEIVRNAIEGIVAREP